MCAVRLSGRQLAFMDAQRGNLTRSAWIRMLILAQEQGGVPDALGAQNTQNPQNA